MAYPGEARACVISDWKVGKKAKIKSKFETRVRFIRDREIRQWEYSYAHKYKDSDRIFEIKFEVERIAYRPLFCTGLERRQLVILLFAIEHNNNLKPIGAIETAERRRREVMQRQVELIEYDPDE